jgi:hypothetical protein
MPPDFDGLVDAPMTAIERGATSGVMSRIVVTRERRKCDFAAVRRRVWRAWRER